MTGPTSAVAGSPSIYTLTPGGTVGSDTVTLSDGAGGTFAPSCLTFTSSAAAQTFRYTPATASAKSITATSTDTGVVTGSPLAVSVTAISYTLTGPSGGIGGSPSAAFTLTPLGATTDLVALSDGAGGTFTPSCLTFTSSAAAQTFTYIPAAPGVKALTLTSADGATIAGSPWSYTPTPPFGSIRFFNQCNFSTGTNSLLSNQSQATISFRFQFNTLGGSGMVTSNLVNKAGGFPPICQLSGTSSNLGKITLGMVGSSTSISTNQAIPVGVPCHCVVSWNSSGTTAVYLNGTAVDRATIANSTAAYSGAWTIGATGAGSPVDFQIGDVAVWNGYAATQADVLDLYAGIDSPLTLGTPATAWFPLGGVLGATPAYTDAGFDDWTGNGYNFTSTAGTASNAKYAGPLGYAPPLVTEAYVTKSGKLALFFPVSTIPASNGYYAPQPVTSVPSNPTITWNGNIIQADGPTWTSSSFICPFVAYRLQCGSVESVGIVSGGSGYVCAGRLGPEWGVHLGASAQAAPDDRPGFQGGQ